MSNNFKEIMNNVKDWAVIPTSVVGVFLTKLPASKTESARLVVTINPSAKRRGYMLRSSNELEVLRETIENSKIDELIKELESVFGVVASNKMVDI